MVHSNLKDDQKNDVGNERDTDVRGMAHRMAKLERAVRELQNRVYDLEDDARPIEREVKVVTCVMNTTFNGAFIGKSSTEIEARANTINNCKKGGREAFCSTNQIKCETSVEIVRN